MFLGAMTAYFEGMYILAWLILLNVTLPLFFETESYNKYQILIYGTMVALIILTPFVLYRDVAYRFLILGSLTLLITQIDNMAWLFYFRTKEHFLFKLSNFIARPWEHMKYIALISTIAISLVSSQLIFM